MKNDRLAARLRAAELDRQRNLEAARLILAEPEKGYSLRREWAERLMKQERERVAAEQGSNTQ